MLEFLGRIDHQVKVNGYRIELGEIEAVLGRDPAVHEAVVVARDAPGGGSQLAAYVVPAAPVDAWRRASTSCTSGSACGTRPTHRARRADNDESVVRRAADRAVQHRRVEQHLDR